MQKTLELLSDSYTAVFGVNDQLSGLLSTPGGAFEIAYLLGRDETLARIEKAVEKLS